MGVSFRWPRICSTTVGSYMRDTMHSAAACAANQDIQVEDSFEELMPGTTISAADRLGGFSIVFPIYLPCWCRQGGRGQQGF